MEELPLHLAAWSGHAQTCSELIRHNADLNIKDIEGETALHNTLHFNRRETAVLLFKAGIDVNIKNNEGKSGLDFIIKEGFLDEFKQHRHGEITPSNYFLGDLKDLCGVMIRQTVADDKLEQMKEEIPSSLLHFLKLND